MLLHSKFFHFSLYIKFIFLNIYALTRKAQAQNKIDAKEKKNYEINQILNH
jgi:hypothetical protein